jgi:hypothetical protein
MPKNLTREWQEWEDGRSPAFHVMYDEVIESGITYSKQFENV